MTKKKLTPKEINKYFEILTKRVELDVLVKFYTKVFELDKYEKIKKYVLNKKSEIYKDLADGFTKTVSTSFSTICKNGTCKGKESTVTKILEGVLSSDEKKFGPMKLFISGYNFTNLDTLDMLNLFELTETKYEYNEYKENLGDFYEKIVYETAKSFNKKTLEKYKDSFVSLFNMPEEMFEEIVNKAKDAETVVEEVIVEEKEEKKTKSDAQWKKEVTKKNAEIQKLTKELDDTKKAYKKDIKDYESKIEELKMENFELRQETPEAQDNKNKREIRRLTEENKELKEIIATYEFRDSVKEETINDLENDNEENTFDEIEINGDEDEEKEEMIIDDNIDEIDFINSLNNALKSAALSYKYTDLLNFHIACKSSMLNILAGPSGTGKTRLPLMYAEAINCKEAEGNLLFLPVSPSFTEPSDVLGFYSAQDKMYHPSDTGLAEFLINAQNDKDKKMYMVIFDEMNLSQIEYWFAPFLSVLEKPEGQRTIRLYSSSVECTNKDAFPDVISLYDNVLFIGTINLDETTKDLSDRLIDRAIIINLEKPSFIEHWDIVNNMEETKFILKSNMTYNGFNRMRAEEPDPYNEHLYEEEINFLDELYNEIQKVNSSKGVSFRNVKKICFYLEQANSLFSEKYNRNQCFDLIFSQTILKKINGYDDSIKALLGKLDDDDNIKDSILVKVFDNNKIVSDFTISKKEIVKKIKEFKNYGFTR